MRCGDLERYLEAFLDGRLSRGRRTVLRRHLALCSACQARVERLRQFERETQSRFRALEEPGSVWEGLALDLVGSQQSAGQARLLAIPRPAAVRSFAERLPARAEPVRPSGGIVPSGRRPARATASRLAGVLLIAMALGSVYQLARGERGQAGTSWAARAYLDQERMAAPDLSTTDARRAEAWLTAELGRPVPPVPMPAGFGLVGVSRVEPGGDPGAAVIYAADLSGDASTVMLFVRSTAGEASAPTESEGDEGLRELSWDVGGLNYAAVGPVSEDQLRQFAPGGAAGQ